MISERPLTSDLEAVRAEYAPNALTFDLKTDSETLAPAVTAELGVVVESLDPATYPRSWLPDDAPSILRRYAGSEFTIGMPGDGTVIWTRQTEPPCVFAKYRARGTPEAFLEFLLAEAYVQLSSGVPEHFLPFFGSRYRSLREASGLSPGETYQLAAALFDGWVGLHTREEFVHWADRHPSLWDAWRDAGDRLAGGLDDLSGDVARGERRFAAAAEYACAAIKHDLDLPAPFAALDTAAYREHGSEYAVRWTEKTFDQLR
ncbi:MAG: DUF7089 family protein [Halobacteriota archaeon]